VLTIGSRGSQLALWQARWIQARLAALGHESRIEIIHTTGDRITDVPLAKVGTKGLFTKEIEEALLRGDIDVAVHSMKDMPTDVPDGLAIDAVPERDDPRDALVGVRLDELPERACVGTSSLRRTAQLHALRPDLEIDSLRGNVDTRLRKVEERHFDAIVLAAAGLRRLGLQQRIAEVLDPAVMCPAVGQGALAVETRNDGEAFQLCAQLNHPETYAAVAAERAVLAELGGGCQVPIGAHARIEGDVLHIDAIVVSPDGNQVVRLSASGPARDHEQIGIRLGRELLLAGAEDILDAVYGETGG